MSAGYSGMAALGGDRYVVVHDTKSQHDGVRLAVVEVHADREVDYTPLEVSGWPAPWGRSNDFEGVCAIPGRPRELLAVEASFWRGRPRRLVHLELAAPPTAAPAKVLAAPVLPPAGADESVDGAAYYEGIVCAAAGDDVLVILGQYGGPAGARLRWGRYRAGEIAFDEAGDRGLEVTVPGRWRGAPRAIADLHLDGDRLWGVAAEDPGDAGPFRSVIYAVATVDPAAAVPVTLLDPPIAGWTVEGFKIEALAAGASVSAESPMSFGTEDESFGGVWRPLPPRRPAPPR